MDNICGCWKTHYACHPLYNDIQDQELYTAVLEDLASLIPQFQPKGSMSDWEPAPRNAFKEIYPQMKLYGCWFHFTQRIWAKTQKLGLMTHINEIIKDTDNDISRLYQGREISRPRAKTDLKIGEHRLSLKQKLNNGELTPWEFVQAMSYTFGDIKTHAVYLSSESDLSDVEDEQTTNMEIICSVCLSQRRDTWIFMPCRHASFCGDCSERLVNLGDQCPICRGNIEERLEIFTN